MKNIYDFFDKVNKVTFMGRKKTSVLISSPAYDVTIVMPHKIFLSDKNTIRQKEERN